MKKRIIGTIALSAALLAPTSIFAKSFTDVNKGDWYYEVVSELTDKGIINGYEDGTFKPYKPVTLAEFLTLMNNTIGVKQAPDAKDPFNWFNPTFDELRRRGMDIIEGVQDPDYEAMREEIAEFLSVGLQKLKNEKADFTRPKDIKDFDKIPKEYQPYVAHLVNAGYIKGDQNNNFNGKQQLTRAETAVIIKAISGK